MADLTAITSLLWFTGAYGGFLALCKAMDIRASRAPRTVTDPVAELRAALSSAATGRALPPGDHR